MKMGRKGRRKGRERHILNLAVQQKSASDHRKIYRNAGIGLIGFCVLLLVCLAAHIATETALQKLFYENEMFAIKKVDVQLPDGTLTRDEILRAARIRQGTGLMALDLDEVRSRIENIPSVASARIQRQLPSTLVIAVDERQPIARLAPVSRTGARLGQAVYYIDQNGFVIKPKPGERLKPLPMITGVDSEYVVEGTRLDRPEVISALSLLRLADYSVIKNDLDLTQIEVQKKGYLILRTQNKGSIRFRTDYLSQQIQRLEHILDKAREDQHVVKTVDLSPERNVPVTYFN